MATRLLLVDGHNLLFQMYYGMPGTLVGSQGEAIQGVVGFVGGLRNIMAMTNPTHVAVLFDSEAPLLRRALDAGYKANRPTFEEGQPNPFDQLPHIYRALDHMGIAHAEAGEVETDDVIAAYALRAPVDEVVICSADADYLQLVSPRVQVLRYRGKSSILWDEAAVMAKYGVPANRFADYKALVGDPSDNIAGLAKVGPKTAAKLIAQHGSVPDLVRKLQLSGPDTPFLASLDVDLMQRNYQLVRLTGDAPMPIDTADCRWDGDVKAMPKTMEIIAAIGL